MVRQFPHDLCTQSVPQCDKAHLLGVWFGHSKTVADDRLKAVWVGLH